MYSSKHYSPLRYPGGKAAFAPYIASVMEQNGFQNCHYLEPYAGGAGVALDLLFHGHACHIHINDLDPAVYSFWVAATRHARKLLNLLEKTPITIDEWFKWRAVLRGEVKATIVERGFATLFLNRTNRSGILKAGVIGGKKQEGHYKLNARFNKDDLARRIERIAQNSKKISVYCEDSLQLLKRCSDFLPRKSFVYLDPPYYVKGEGLYRNFYIHADHAAIARYLQLKKFVWPWVVSYDNSPEICAMYNKQQFLKYDIKYTAQRKYVGNEVMFFSPLLQIPDGSFKKDGMCG